MEEVCNLYIVYIHIYIYIYIYTYDFQLLLLLQTVWIGSFLDMMGKGFRKRREREGVGRTYGLPRVMAPLAEGQFTNLHRHRLSVPPSSCHTAILECPVHKTNAETQPIALLPVYLCCHANPGPPILLPAYIYICVSPVLYFGSCTSLPTLRHLAFLNIYTQAIYT